MNFVSKFFYISFGRIRKFFGTLCNGGKHNYILICDDDDVCHRVKKINGLKIVFHGKNSCVKIYKPFHFRNSIINVGNNNQIIIGKKSSVRNLNIPMKMSDNSKLIIGDNFAVMGANIYLHDECDRCVTIGDDCLFSFGITIWPSDGHTITDLNGNILNRPKNISVGNRVWIGMNVTILKGANIPDGSIIGAHSLYLNSSNPDENVACVFVGHPAKAIKRGDFAWWRQNTDVYEKKYGEKND